MVNTNASLPPKNPASASVVATAPILPKRRSVLKTIWLGLVILLLLVGLVWVAVFAYRIYYERSNTGEAANIGNQFMEAFKQGDGSKLELLFTARNREPATGIAAQEVLDSPKLQQLRQYNYSLQQRKLIKLADPRTVELTYYSKEASTGKEYVLKLFLIETDGQWLVDGTNFTLSNFALPQ